MKLSEKFMSISPSPTLSIDAKFKDMIANGIDVVGFGAGEPDFDTPSHIKQQQLKPFKTAYKIYASAGTVALKGNFEKFLKDNNLSYSPSDIVVSNGAKHSLVNVFAILNAGDEVIIPAPFG